ncbi:MAG TPA: methyltransferase domain-containing protein [Candidatus Baltobacteraceae bacterium]|nr:methyltransferase domain-containing protein [Candidatus Baltobacteraceae bacterium]
MEQDAALRESLIAQLERAGALRSPSIAAAMRAVPRHRFVPETPLEEAYADRAIALKTDGNEVLSSISQPGMIAQMLELLAPCAGNDVLEIGTGSGYNAALLAHAVGPSGSVTSVELDAGLAERARSTLHELGHSNVRVLAADGVREPFERRYDRLIVSARSDDIAAAWWNAVREDGRLVVPLRLESAGEYAVGFVLRGRRLYSIGVHPCAFIALRGEAARAAPGDVFFRDPSMRQAVACTRRVGEVLALPREDATPALLEDADVVVASAVTLFALKFA